jgi:XTP/dITP diphosphohydrolase
MVYKLEGRIVFFATNNVHKFEEACKVLVDHGIAVGMLRVKSLEIQSDSLEDIAKTSVAYAFRKCKLPLIVEDAGLFVELLGGFPGPYAAYVYKTIGNNGLLRLMNGVENRKARFESAIAYLSTKSKPPLSFRGEVAGEITREERKGKNKAGFGFDPIFKPATNDKTFAEMTIDEKNTFSHRAKALHKFAEWYKSLR